MRIVSIVAVLFVATATTAAVAQAPIAASLDALTRFQNYEAQRASSSNPDIDRNGDARPIEAGGTLVLADLEGPGVITHIWNTVGTREIFYPQSIVLRVYYDGAEQPSVEAPLGDFFGMGYGAYKDYISAVSSITSLGRSRTCYWRMPFRKSIRITATNESPEKVDSFYFYVDWQKHESLPEDTAYFHARYNQAHPAQPGRYTLLETEGRGHYVGTVYSTVQNEVGWYGEGDDFFFIDGAEEPQLRGTGTEDYFNDAWGFREFNAPYHGVAMYEGIFPGDRVSVYRWHIPDPIPFRESLRVEIEHRGSIFNDTGNLTNFELGTFEERADWLSSVAYWYQYPPAHFDTPIPPRDERILPWRVVKPADLEWRANPPMLVVPDNGAIMYVPGKPEYTLEIDVEIEEAGRYRVDVVLMNGVIVSNVAIALNDEPIGAPHDLHSTGLDPVFLSLDLHDLEPGTHTLRFTGVDAPSPKARTLAPPFNALSVQRILLLRLQDIEGYRVVTERLLQEK